MSKVLTTKVIKANGATFCTVKIKNRGIQSKPEDTLGTQKCMGKMPNLIKVLKTKTKLVNLLPMSENTISPE